MMKSGQKVENCSYNSGMNSEIDAEYYRGMQKRLRWYVAIVVIGVVMCVVSWLGMVENAVVSYFGLAFAVSGAVRIRNHILLCRRPGLLHRTALAVQDERNIMLQNRARSMAFILFVVLMGVLVLVLSLFGRQEYANMLAFNVLLLVLIYWASYYYVSHRY